MCEKNPKICDNYRKKLTLPIPESKSDESPPASSPQRGV